PAVQVQGAPVKDRDGLRMEVEAEARDAGIRQLIPMKGQPLERQLADLKANKEKFREEMGAANQKSREKARGKTALPQPTEKQCAEHAEKQQKKAYQERRIRL
ncbi:MAG: hypothetical protein J6Y62_10115, partial [Clostridia bacterium]|nr:hypothetical protein [Clostridia bacterium]